MLKRCSKCGEHKEPVKGIWKMKYGKPNGRVCLSCERLRQQQLVMLPTGEVVTYTAAASRRYLATEEGRAKSNASAVKRITARLKVDAWFRLKCQLATETCKLMKKLAVGRGTDYMCLKLFGKPRTEVFAHIDAQLKARGFEWENHGDEWVLDHIRPLAMAQSSIELYQLCLLENCQVLTPAENAIKAIADRELIRQHELSV